MLRNTVKNQDSEHEYYHLIYSLIELCRVVVCFRAIAAKLNCLLKVLRLAALLHLFWTPPKKKKKELPFLDDARDANSHGAGITNANYETLTLGLSQSTAFGG